MVPILLGGKAELTTVQTIHKALHDLPYYLKALISPHSPYSLSFSHIGLLAVSQTHKASTSLCPLNRLSSLFGMLFLQLSVQISPSLHSGLCLNVPPQEDLS